MGDHVLAGTGDHWTTTATLASGDGALGAFLELGDGGLQVADLSADLVDGVLGRAREGGDVLASLVAGSRCRAHLGGDVIELGELLLMGRERRLHFGEADRSPGSDEQGDNAHNDATDREHAVIFARDGVHE